MSDVYSRNVTAHVSELLWHKHITQNAPVYLFSIISGWSWGTLMWPILAKYLALQQNSGRRNSGTKAQSLRASPCSCSSLRTHIHSGLVCLSAISLQPQRWWPFWTTIFFIESPPFLQMAKTPILFFLIFFVVFNTCAVITFHYRNQLEPIRFL